MINKSMLNKLYEIELLVNDIIQDIKEKEEEY